MRRLWLALWLAALGWDALLPHIEGSDPTLAAAALVAAALLLISRSESGIQLGPRLAIGLAAACGTAAALLPWPEALGPILIGSGCLVAAASRFNAFPSWWLWRLPAGLGTMLVVLATTSHVYRYAESRLHDLDWLAAPMAASYRLLGIDASADPPFVHLQGVGNLHSFDCSLEKLVGHAFAHFFSLAAIALVILHGRGLGWRRPARLLLAALVFAWLRTLGLGLLLDDVPNASNYYLRGWSYATLLPFVAILAVILPPLLPLRRAAAPGGSTDRALAGANIVRLSSFRQPRVAALATGAALLGILVAGAIGFFDPGRRKASARILIDERHSNWEWSTIALDAHSYGVQTVYNYSELVRYLRFFYEVEPNFEPLTDSLLAHTDVLILKTPTRPYEDVEVDAVVRFVENGGGLWLIGDHTNVFGMSTNLNKVARRFGMRYRFDAAVDLLTFGRQLYRHPRLFGHPSVRHLPTILMATSSTMVASLDARSVMSGRSLLSDELDYSVNTFFGDFRPQPDEPFGTMLQSLAVTRGRGRVLAFSDSTIFSNFFMFIRGKPELALGSVQWLLFENRWGWMHGLMRLLAIGTLVGFVVLAARLPRRLVLTALVPGLLTFAATARGMDRWVASWSQLPQPRSPLPIVAFERGRTSYHVPDLSELPDHSPFSFHTFYVWTQRVGYVPTTRSLRGCLEGSQIVVLINPFDHFPPRELDSLRQYVHQGGRLLVLDSPHSRHSSANDILGRFGLRFEAAEMESVTVFDPVRGDSLVVLPHVKPVTGGEPALLLPDGSAALAVASLGEGIVAAMCASDSFNDAVLGTTSEVPDEAQLALFQLQFKLFDETLRPPLGPGPAR
jgi:hypothetical protein